MLYIIENCIYDQYTIGVRKKVKAQCRVFEKEFGRAYYTTKIGGMVYLLHEDTIIEKQVCLSKKDFYVQMMTWIEKYGFQRVYIRHNMGSKWLIEFSEYLQKNNIKKLIEIHTYNARSEYGSEDEIDEDLYYTNKLSNYYDTIVGGGEIKKYKGMKVIPLINGIDLEEHPISRRSYKRLEGNDEINLLGVAMLGYWQGYDRLIEGMNEYYNNGGKKNINFYIIGDGEEYDSYDRMRREYGIEDRVVLTGAVEDDRELNKYYDMADIGVGALGLYRRNMDDAATIKLREYCARGIPFIYAYNDQGFTGNEEYSLKIENNDKAVDVLEIVKFFNKNIQCISELAKSMRYMAENKFTWNVLMKEVINEYL